MIAFRHHAAVFVAVNAALHAANLLVGASWWAFWPLAAWSVLLAAHYFVHRTRRADEQWVQERTDDVRSKSYDRAHMDDIAARHSGPEEK